MTSLTCNAVTASLTLFLLGHLNHNFVMFDHTVKLMLVLACMSDVVSVLRLGDFNFKAHEIHGEPETFKFVAFSYPISHD